MDGWLYSWMDGWKDELMDGWMDGWRDFNLTATLRDSGEFQGLSSLNKSLIMCVCVPR